MLLVNYKTMAILLVFAFVVSEVGNGYTLSRQVKLNVSRGNKWEISALCATAELSIYSAM